MVYSVNDRAHNAWCQVYPRTINHSKVCKVSMKAAIAVRVSPRPQENIRYSPEIQEQTCRDWCAQNGHEVVTIPVHHRPGGS